MIINGFNCSLQNFYFSFIMINSNFNKSSLMSGLQTQRKFEKFSGDETVKKTMEIFTELLA